MGMGGGMMGGNVQTRGPQSISVADWARMVQQKRGASADNRGQLEGDRLANAGNKSGMDKALQSAKQTKEAFDQARTALANKQHLQTQSGQLGVDLSVQSNELRNQSRLTMSAQRKVAGHNIMEIGGVWIDEDFNAKMPTFTIQALSPAYFRLLERQPHLRELFQLGNNLVWVTPSGFALMIDLNHGHETLGNEMLDHLFKKRPG
jgi:Ca-activated chloride channel family protein